MVSDEQIDAAVRQAQTMQRQVNQQMLGRLLQPAPALRLNPQGVLEVVAEGERDTHDEWRELNGDG